MFSFTILRRRLMTISYTSTFTELSHTSSPDSLLPLLLRFRCRRDLSVPFTPTRRKAFAGKFFSAVIRLGHRSCHVITRQVSSDAKKLENSFDDNICKSKSHIDGLCKIGHVADAVVFLRHLLDRRIRVDRMTYNSLLAAAVEHNRFDIFSEVFRHLLFSNTPPDLIAYLNAAKAFENLAYPVFLDFIKEVIEITKEKDPTVINKFIYITAKSGQIDKSIEIFEELKKKDFTMNTVTYNTIILILGRAGQVDLMLSYFNSMKDLGYVPDLITYNTLINCLRWLGRLDLCKVFVKEMVNRGLELDLRTYTSIIDALGRAGYVMEASEMFNEMKKSHQPSIYILRGLINNMKKAGKFELSLSLLDEMNSSYSRLVGPEDFKRKKIRKATRKRG